SDYQGSCHGVPPIFVALENPGKFYIYFCQNVMEACMVVPARIGISYVAGAVPRHRVNCAAEKEL
ncbi:MAG TPA: hypothetical protein PK272_10095, partial [Methanoregulaceae archaeon]|nr:hypothetical protein [Methanoregulaceae archaeon]